MEEFNIENYRDCENVTIAQYVAAKANVEKMAMDSAKKGDLKTAMHYAKIYFELNKLHGEKIKSGSGLGYKPKGRAK